MAETRGRMLAALAVVAGAGLARPAAAEGFVSRRAPEMQLSDPARPASYPAIAALTDGTFLVVWQAPVGDVRSTPPPLADVRGIGFAVEGQLVDRLGRPVGHRFEVAPGDSLQVAAEVAATTGGEFVVVWTRSFDLYPGSASRIYGRRVDASGSPIASEFAIEDARGAYRPSAAIEVTADGGFLVVWERYDDAFARRFAADGSPLASEWILSPPGHTVLPENIAVVGGGDGTFEVFWTGLVDPATRERAIEGRRLDASGMPIAGVFEVNSYTTGRQFGVHAARDGLGSRMAVWSGSERPDAQGAFSVQAVARSLDPLDSEFVVDPRGFQVATDIAPAGAGEFAVVWNESTERDPDGGVGLVLVDAVSRIAGPIAVNAYTPGAQTHASVAVSATGALVAWRQDLRVGGIADVPDAVMARFLPRVIFDDGFESGDTTAWAEVVSP